jgi:hypothetical protein
MASLLFGEHSFAERDFLGEIVDPIGREYFSAKDEWLRVPAKPVR